jgi:hypothetical protein
MPASTTYAAFLMAVLAMQLVPGPETMLVMSRGIGQGRWVAFWTVLGMTVAAGAIQLPLLALGIASVVRSSPFAFGLLRWRAPLTLSGWERDCCVHGGVVQPAETAALRPPLPRRSSRCVKA